MRPLYLGTKHIVGLPSVGGPRKGWENLALRLSALRLDLIDARPPDCAFTNSFDRRGFAYAAKNRASTPNKPASVANFTT